MRKVSALTQRTIDSVQCQMKLTGQDLTKVRAQNSQKMHRHADPRVIFFE